MSALSGKNIVLGLSGSIAAHKGVKLVRLFQKQGALVRVMMTPSAESFVSKLTLETISGYPVATHVLDLQQDCKIEHIELARWADLIVLAPATAQTLAELAHGFASNALTSTCLASDRPMMIAPAMNRIMWENPATQINLKLLKERGYTILNPDSGEQACGETGPGRLLEPELITQATTDHFSQQPTLIRKHLIITGGGTREYLDPVRFIGNPASGKMGVALAEAALARGAQVTYIYGSYTTAPQEHPNLKAIPITDNQSMYTAVMAALPADGFIGAAAVGDYTVAQPSEHKVKKQDAWDVTLVKAKDIIAEVVNSKQAGFVMGFAAESEQLETYAKQKLKNKGLDAIFANDISGGQGFGTDQNQGTLYLKEASETQFFESTLKTELAAKILNHISKYLN